MKNETKNSIVIGILLVCFILLFVIPAVCQKTSGVTYKTVQTEIFFKDENPWFKGGTMIDFRGSYILTTYKDQMSKIYIDGPWKQDVWEYEDGRPNWNHLEAQAHDNSGSNCYLYYGYDERLKTHKLWVVYNNTAFCHWMHPTDEIMYDIMDELPPHTMADVEYTDAQVAKFLKDFGFFLF